MIFIVGLTRPYLLDDDIAYDTRYYLVQAVSAEEVLALMGEKAQSNWGPKNQDVKVALRNLGYIGDEYYGVFLHQVSEDDRVVHLGELPQFFVMNHRSQYRI